MEKKFFEEPTVQKVEFEFNERIAASACLEEEDYEFEYDSTCLS